MKKIEVVYRNRDNSEAINYLKGILGKIFEESVRIENCFINELAEDATINADVYVVVDRNLLAKLRQHTTVFRNIVMMTRSAKKEHLDEIMKISRNEEVLIVNDTYQSAEEMAFTLYELGIGHLNLIPYDETKVNQGIYDHIEYAITPNEPQLVPVHIKNVINTGYREIGFDTLVQIMNVLDLNNERVNYNLIGYISTIIEPMKDFQINYLNGFLKEQMLNEYVYDSPSSIFVADTEGRIVYYNRKAKNIFGFNANSSARVDRYLPLKLMKEINSHTDISKMMIAIDDVNYIMDKMILSVAKQEMGYLVTMQDEIVIKDIETSFNKKLKEKGLYAKYSFNNIRFVSGVMGETIELAKKAAGTEYTILIRGESGTGKELFAQSMHNYSSRKNMPFVGVNCAAIPESLLESELFGYEEGAFTGASKKGKLGYFEQANKGTIFLDEIGDISPKLQARLLRVLQERQIMKIGSDKVVNVDVRIIAATNKDLLQEVKDGRFRDDLYYRLNAIQIFVPPLRERIDDIIPLFEQFMGKDYANVTMMDRSLLALYDWPGNVRELENCALYYKTLGKLPSQFDGKATEEGKLTKIVNSDQLLKKRILNVLEEESQINHGVGRTVLLQRLADERYKISDVALRKILSQLEDQGLVEIGLGRQGTRITEDGRDYIRRF